MTSIFVKLKKSACLLGGILAFSTMVASPAIAQPKTPIRIGEINSYTGGAPFTVPYKKGFDLAVEEINAKGGVIGRPLQVIYRDDNLSPADGVRAANELILNEKVDVLAGTFSSAVGLAVADFANRQKKVFVATEPLTDDLVWAKGSRYVFRMRSSIYMLTSMIVKEAAANPAKRWATVSPNFEGGQAFVKEFKKQLSALRPDVVWVGEQWPAPNKLEAGPTVDALEASKPDAIFNVTYGPDLVRFVREGNTRGVFEKRFVVSVLSGEPEYLDPLKDETPEGWLVTGYVYQDERPQHVAFRKAYEAKYKDYPRFGSLMGYTAAYAIAGGIKRANSVDSEKLVEGLKGLEMDSPMGKIKIRSGDHQATTGAWIGKLAKKDGKGMMVNWKFMDGAAYLPSEVDAVKMRPAGSN